jgi:predicted MFS family arabinose efflux permease
MGAAQLLGRIGLGTYLKFLKERPLLVVPFATMASALLILPFTGNSSASWLLLGIVGSFSGLLTLLRPILVSRLFEVHVFGRVNGVLALTYQLARAGGPVGGAWVFEMAGGYQVVFWCLASMLVVAAFLSKHLQKERGSSGMV